MTGLDDAVLIVTAWRRPAYLQRVLDSWAQARGVAGLRKVVFALGQSPAEAQQRAIMTRFCDAAGVAGEVMMDSPACARVPGPHRSIAEAANRNAAGAGLLIFSEEDTQVSSDVLEFIAWGRDIPGALAVCAHNALGNGWQRDAPDDADADQSAARLRRSFSPWCWAVTPQTWADVLEPDWDYDCNKGPRPDQHGYDWQVQRIVERTGPALVPDAARSQNIGRDGGVFANPAEFGWTQAKSFREHRDVTAYRLEEEIS